MTDVRLTATNPEDSSVVPVACNSRGELLVTEPVIEQIDNDVTIKGNMVIQTPAESVGGVDWEFGQGSGILACYRKSQDLRTHDFGSGGQATHSRFKNDATLSVALCGSTNPFFIVGSEGTGVYWINWTGVASGPSFRIKLEPNNPVHYSSVRNTETGEETKEYIGPVLDVREELEFLRAQVRALMEKLNMSPEGGWPVWDGSTET